MKPIKIFLQLFTFISLGICANHGFAQPLNDNCSNASTLTVGAPCTNGTNVGATIEAGETVGATGTGCWLTAPNNTVWYQFTTGAAGNYTVSTDNGGSTDTQIKILSGTCGAFTSVACDEDGGTINGFASIATAALPAATTYFVQVDVYNTATGTFCINVTYNPPIPNDCIFNAFDITSLINGVSLPLTPFNCRPSDLYSSVASPATRQDLTGDPNGCEICDLSCTTKNPDHRDIWYRFTVSAATPATWLTVYNELPEPGGAPTFATAIYSGTPTGICGAGNIGGMAQIDCSAGDILPVCTTPPFACEDGGGFGIRNKAICTTPNRPRIDISGLANGTYYFRIWDWAGGTPNNGRVIICAESAVTNPPTQDKCPNTNTIGCISPDANAEFDSTYVNLSNAGMTGNSCSTDPNEPQVAAGPSTDYRITCSGVWTTGIGYVNNVMNNSAIYRFEVNALAPCVCKPVIMLSNITYGGRTGNAVQVQVMNNPCAAGSSTVMASSTNANCLEMRMASNGTIPNGVYYIVVDGQDGQLIEYDLTLKLNYSGAGCTPLAVNVCNVSPLPVELQDFSVHAINQNQAQISWATSSETNNDYFIVERTNNVGDFKELKRIDGSGNSNDLILYKTMDIEPLEGTSYYRLKQVDFDGNFKYSDPISFTKPAIQEFKPLYPNPANHTITVFLKGYSNAISIAITNVMGASFYSENINNNDIESTEIDVTHLPNGLYLLKMELANGDAIISKFFKE